MKRFLFMLVAVMLLAASAGVAVAVEWQMTIIGTTGGYPYDDGNTENGEYRVSNDLVVLDPDDMTSPGWYSAVLLLNDERVDYVPLVDGFRESSGYAINANNQIVGNMTCESNNLTAPFIWSSANGTALLAGYETWFNAGYNFIAEDLSDDGLLVTGYCWGSNDDKPWVWTAGGGFQLLPNGGYSRTMAQLYDESTGEIYGLADWWGTEKIKVKWTPVAVPEPGSMLVLFTGVVSLAGIVRRNRK